MDKSWINRLCYLLISTVHLTNRQAGNSASSTRVDGSDWIEGTVMRNLKNKSVPGVNWMSSGRFPPSYSISPFLDHAHF